MCPYRDPNLPYLTLSRPQWSSSDYFLLSRVVIISRIASPSLDSIPATSVNDVGKISEKEWKRRGQGREKLTFSVCATGGSVGVFSQLIAPTSMA
jgi:hypothetical protein